MWLIYEVILNTCLFASNLIIVSWSKVQHARGCTGPLIKDNLEGSNLGFSDILRTFSPSFFLTIMILILILGTQNTIKRIYLYLMFFKGNYLLKCHGLHSKVFAERIWSHLIDYNNRNKCRAQDIKEESYWTSMHLALSNYFG